MRRRSWLMLGVGSAAALAIGGGAITLVAPGLRNARLTPESRIIMHSVAGACLAGILPAERAPRAAALHGLLARIDPLVAGLPAHAQGELSQLLALLATSIGRRALAGLTTPWSQTSPAHVEAALQSMRVSGAVVRRQAYQALHDIVGAAYVSDHSTWAVLGYPGPVPVQ